MEKLNTIERQAIHIRQPLGDFFVFSLDANTLNRIAFSLPAEATVRLESERDDRGGYRIFGSQRDEKPKRLEEIAKFIRSADATFPNAIILAANYDAEGNLISEEDNRWSIQTKGDLHFLRIPTTELQSASIIDGQHRLHAFLKLPEDAPQRSMELLCVVFLDLPTPYHAYIFATINFNQKKVDRSLAYELFGFDVEDRSPEFWVPETLAVYLARVLNTEPTSPLYKSIAPAADVTALFEKQVQSNAPIVKVSMATVVDGILRLVSKMPKDDRYTMRRPENLDRGRSALLPISDIPLRTHYIAGNDKAIFDVVCNFFGAVRETVWSATPPHSYLRKTVGVQAFFDVLRILVKKENAKSSMFSVNALNLLLTPCQKLDPKGDSYQASGIGRTKIRTDILSALGIQ